MPQPHSELVPEVRGMCPKSAHRALCATQKPVGYCWQIYFKVLEVPLLAHVSQDFFAVKEDV